MSEHYAEVRWSREEAVFTDNRYSRGHLWRFDEDLEIPASSSPVNVPLPLSVARAVDPEEAFVACLSSCHMLWFLSIAARRGFVVESYIDAAMGEMGRDASGKTSMIRVTLHPHVLFDGLLPGPEQLSSLHHEAHNLCYIANSVKTEVRCEPR